MTFNLEEYVTKNPTAIGDYKIYGALPRLTHKIYEMTSQNNKQFVSDKYKTEVNNLCDIILSGTVEALREFNSKYPFITLDTEVTSQCMCGCIKYISGYVTLTHYKMSANKITLEFIDELFNLGYLNSSDIYFLHDYLYGMTSYDEFVIASHILKKLDPIVVATSFYVLVYTIENINYSYYYDTLTAFYTSFMIHYYGKLHGNSLKFYNILSHVMTNANFDVSENMHLPKLYEFKEHNKLLNYAICNNIIDTITYSKEITIRNTCWTNPPKYFNNNEDQFENIDMVYWNTLPDLYIGYNIL